MSLLVVTIIVFVVTVIHFRYIYLRAVPAACALWSSTRCIVHWSISLIIESILTSFFSLVCNKVTDSHEVSRSRVEGLYKTFKLFACVSTSLENPGSTCWQDLL